MIVHLAIFGLYIFSSLAAIIFAFKGGPVETESTLLLFVYFISSFTQCMICYIFWNINNIPFVPVPAERDIEEVS
jgi:hypothetical protein